MKALDKMDKQDYMVIGGLALVAGVSIFFISKQIKKLNANKLAIQNVIKKEPNPAGLNVPLNGGM